METVLLAVPHGDQLIAVASEFTQNADIRFWDEAAFYKANTKQIADPLGIFRIILVSLYSLHPFGICNDDSDTPFFKDVEYRDPVFPGGFHTDIQTVVFQKPVSKSV